MFDSQRTYVALDIETTGLDPTDDRITEIGAMRFDETGRELAVFDQLINPGRAIPAFTEKLTGITNEDVREAPAFAEVADDLAAFVGESAVVGQNVRFDLAFLAEAGVEFEGPALDTLRFARVLFPEGPGALSDLAAELGVEMPVAHRALADARTAALVFLELRRRAAALPPGERAAGSETIRGAGRTPALASRSLAGGKRSRDESSRPAASPSLAGAGAAIGAPP